VTPTSASRACEPPDAEKRYLIGLIRQDRPLPKKCRFVRIEDEREVERVWNGKTRGWTNQRIRGDHKPILSILKSDPLRAQIEEAGDLKFTDMDPPFDVDADFSTDIEIPSSEGTGETFHKEPVSMD
jgi:hypothetical protein